jgi:hypothetical protein
MGVGDTKVLLLVRKSLDSMALLQPRRDLNSKTITNTLLSPYATLCPFILDSSKTEVQQLFRDEMSGSPANREAPLSGSVFQNHDNGET